MDKTFSKEIGRVQQAALDAMRRGMFMIEADTKQLCPVDSGTLKRSYASDAVIDGDNIIGTVGSDVEYAVWADMKKPHLTEAVDKNQETVKGMIEQALRR